jgi:hypothetical protein
MTARWGHDADCSGGGGGGGGRRTASRTRAFARLPACRLDGDGLTCSRMTPLGRCRALGPGYRRERLVAGTGCQLDCGGGVAMALQSDGAVVSATKLRPPVRGKEKR